MLGPQFEIHGNASVDFKRNKIISQMSSKIIYSLEVTFVCNELQIAVKYTWREADSFVFILTVPASTWPPFSNVT